MPLGIIGAAFFAGRTISYSVWAHVGRLASTYIDLEFPIEGGYLSGYFIVSQIALLRSVYILMKLDWKTLIEQRKLKWRRAMRDRDVGRRGRTVKR
ncbi:hypothetical protein PPMP20_02380 [Paraburkholderia phymatum]|uniref:hypothetical protein n=1 Tax=Paraburkholderia phymatum TaxID=148447 RepID=UPI0000E78F2B|nr:hypothetical protein [Paraburkholderia phymatum]